MTGTALRGELARWFLHQAEASDLLGSPLYGRLCRAAADDARAGGPVWEVAEAVAEDELPRPRGGSIPLEILAAVHRLVLEGEAPALAAHYPSVGGRVGGDPWPALRQVLVDHAERLRAAMGRSCQTNEVGRSAALIGGVLLVAAEAGRPLRLLEIGASAGLNLRLDRFRYESAHGSWGDPGSPLILVDRWVSAPPVLDVDVHVVERRGCDPSPIDPTTGEGRLAISAPIWPDQTDRFERLDAAIEVARAVPVTVDGESAATWLPRRLSEAAPGTATIVFHSVMLEYMDPPDREAAVGAILSAGDAAGPDAPLAWLRMEPDEGYDEFRVDLTTWPEGRERRLAQAHPHGVWVRWLDAFD
jgi:hypothetical protein